MFDDLYKRVADIANAHYQGADPRPLAGKIAERTGLSETASLRLAKSLDKEFARLVDQAKAKLSKRIAAQRAKQQRALGESPEDGPVDRAIRQQLKKANVRLGELVQQHSTAVDATRRSIGERIVTDAGLTGEAADRLRLAIDRRFGVLAEAAQRSRLGALGRTVPVPRKIQQAYERLIKASNLGALDSEATYNIVREKLGLPAWTPEIAREITRRANQVSAKPEGFQRQRAASLTWHQRITVS